MRCINSFFPNYLTSVGPLRGVSVGTLGILLGTGVLLVAPAGTVGT